jgi:hypothetical protein
MSRAAMMTPRERRIRQKLKTDFPHYADRCLRIRAKSGRLSPFTLNAAQRWLHERLEDQLARMGRVRALVLKARQTGISTYIQGRYFWKVTHGRGQRAFILTHKQSATENLFAIARRFHEHCPDAVRPALKASNARELDFARLDSGYRVGTASTDGVGRSDTIQLFHGSEVAFWPKGDAHAAGVLQAIAGEPGTEAILESTANGIGGLFYNMCRAARSGEGGWEVIFLPWTLHDEYRTDPPSDWQPSAALRDYAALHGLDAAQTCWAEAKNAELAAADGLPADAICWRFRREYPATEQEAFQSSGEDSFILPEWVVRARRASVPDQSHAPLILGIDVARGGGDKTRIIDRQGRQAGTRINRRIDSGDLMEVVGLAAQELDRLAPDQAFVDATGLGAGVVDRLKELGYGRMVTGVNFGSRALNSEVYANRRAEMWGGLRDWLMEPGGVAIPDDDELHAHICAPGAIYTSSQAIRLEAKERIRERLGFSPDAADALALTFAAPVRPQGEAFRWSTAVIDHDPFG